MNIDKPVEIPSHLKSVNPNHLTLLKGYRMVCQAVGNGACGTNCASIHLFEDDSEEARIKLKRKINFHMADHYDQVYNNIIGLPYTETVFGEIDQQTCSTPEELKEFLRSDRALQVYSNFQEIQAIANIFNLAIEVFTYGTQIGSDGTAYQVAGWMDRIQPMAEAANLAEFSEGHFPTMALYHNNDNHFDLLVSDTSRLVTSGLLGRSKAAQVQHVLQEHDSLQEEEWETVPAKSSKPVKDLQGGTRTEGGDRAGQGAKARKCDGGSYLSYLCDKCEVICKNQESLETHKNTHKENGQQTDFLCDDCDQECESDEALQDHMKEEHDDGAWTCDDCQYQANSSELLRQHLKVNGHQPSESSKRQTNEIKICYTCKKEFEGFIALMEHRVKMHPSNRVCKNIPMCTGFVNGRKCWYLHPSGSAESLPAQLEKEIECRRCGKKFPSRNEFMNHYTSDHTSHIVCRDWVKAKCTRVKCWYRHSHLKTSSSVQSVPSPQDFSQLLPPPQPPAWRAGATPPVLQGLTKTQLDIQTMISNMAMRMNTMELEISESRKNMHKLQQMLANTQI